VNRHLVLANLVLFTHALLVFFLVGGIVLVWIGYWRQWHWVRNPWFRLIHLVMMTCVVIQTMAGKLCPLTILEYNLRVKGGAPTLLPGEACIPYWINRIIFLNLPGWTFLALYTSFLILFLLSWWLIRPEWRKCRGEEEKIRAQGPDILRLLL